MITNVLTDGFKLPAGAAPVVCVDIGGTKVAVNIVDAQGIRAKVAEPTATSGPNDALAQQIIRMVGQSCAIAGVFSCNRQVASLAWALFNGIQSSSVSREMNYISRHTGRHSYEGHMQFMSICKLLLDYSS